MAAAKKSGSVTVIYHGPSALLEIPDGKDTITVAAGEPVEIPESVHDRLMADPTITITAKKG